MSRVKRLLVFTTQMMETGGLESHIREFCLHMSGAGIAIDLIVLNSAMIPENEAFFNAVCHRIFLGKYGRSFLRMFWLIRTAWICRKNKYDAIYTNGQGNSTGIFVFLLGRHRNWVHHHHTAGDFNDQQTWTTEYRQTLYKAWKVIACSRSNAQDIENVLKRRVDTVPCFSRKIIVKQKRSENNGVIHFGYYGRLIPEKGIDHLCRLSDDPDLKNIKFHLWGEGSAYPARYFSKHTGLEYHGVFNGQDELSQVISSLDGFLLLSTHPEGLPICLLEAMGAGLPWLATDRGGIPDIVSDPLSTRIISVSSDFQEIKKAVISFSNDLNEGKVSRKVQTELYDRKFSAEALTVKWREIFEFKDIDGR